MTHSTELSSPSASAGRLFVSDGGAGRRSLAAPEDSAAPVGILILPPLYDRQELLLDPISVTFCFSFQSKCQQSGILPHPSSDIFRTNKQLTYLAEINHLKKPQFGSFFCFCFSYYPQVQ